MLMNSLNPTTVGKELLFEIKLFVEVRRLRLKRRVEVAVHTLVSN
jgi:hypothetical protein